MTRRGYDIVILGLSLSSSWGNGHATTWRSLIKGLHALDKRVLFLECDVSWYAENRDLSDPGYCSLAFYQGVEDLKNEFGRVIRDAQAVVVGSYVPDGEKVLDFVLASAGGPVAFYDIDTPITVAALARGDATYIAPRQIPHLNVYLSFTGGPILWRLEDEFGARMAAAFHCSVDDSFYRPLDEPFHWDLGYLGTYSADRQPPLEALLIEPARRLPHLRFVVAGPQYPDGIAWPGNVERINHLPPSEHARFYSRQRFTLNVTRADMIRAGYSPSVRLFEAAACNVPIISDKWPGLTELFADHKAILVASTPDDVINALTRTDAQSRSRIAAQAREVVLARHTGSERARQLLDIFDLLPARPPGPAGRHPGQQDGGAPDHLGTVSS